MRKLDILILSFILFAALMFRLYKINTPLADIHSWRQADTAAVARNFIKGGFDFLHPRFDDLSSNQSGRENPQGFRFVEFPIYNAIFAYLFRLKPIFPLEVYGRLTTAFFSLIVIAIVYYLSLKESNRLTAVVASGLYAILPFFVFFSRVVLPETTALSFTFISIFFLYLYVLEKQKIKTIIFFALSAFSFATSLLVKPTVIFYALVLLYLFFRKYRFSLLKKPAFYLFFLIGAAPFVLWRVYIKNFPEGIPPNDWLITSVNTYQGLRNIFFRPAYFRWIFFERINNFILGGYLTFFLILGILTKPKKYFLHSIFLSSILYLLVFQGGNVQHEYYQTLILPPLAIFIGLGINSVVNNRKSFINPIISYSITALIIGLSFFFSYYKVKDYYNYPSELPQIGKIISTLTREDDKIVTDRMGDTTLLYLSERKGAPSVYKDPPELKKLGYSYFVTLNEDQIKRLKNEKYAVIFENEKFALFKL